ncbi:MAG: VTT domain-containing protein [Oscillospiraceae bacterium]|nr:VTT domain-containing protein [Oscillospiraceae bacterium]
MKMHKALIAVAMVVFFCLLLAMVVQLFPLIRGIITHTDDETTLVTTVQSFGWRGVPALIGLAALQVIVPIIPAPAVGVLTGLSYGIFFGPFIFLAGVALGNMFVVVSVRQFDGLIKAKKTPKNKLKKSHRTIKRPEFAAFLLTLLPWVSSVGPYLFAETKIILWKYIIAVVAGSVPSAVFYVFLGDRISQGSYTTAIVMGAVVAVALAVALIFRKRLMAALMEEPQAAAVREEQV